MIGKIKDLDKYLSDKSFFRIHQSYLVNTIYINSVSNNTIVMKNGAVLNISRSKQKEFLLFYNKYLNMDWPYT